MKNYLKMLLIAALVLPGLALLFSGCFSLTPSGGGNVTVENGVYNFVKFVDEEGWEDPAYTFYIDRPFTISNGQIQFQNWEGVQQLQFRTKGNVIEARKNGVWVTNFVALNVHLEYINGSIIMIIASGTGSSKVHFSR
jgi:hypothetical protein